MKKLLRSLAMVLAVVAMNGCMIVIGSQEKPAEKKKKPQPRLETRVPQPEAEE